MLAVKLLHHTTNSHVNTKVSFEYETFKNFA